MKNREDIIRKREKKKSDLEKTEQLKLNKKNIEYRKKTDIEYHRLLDKAQRKARAYLNKKFLEYDRKCKNEIRKLEWKPQREYKKKKKKLNLVEFAMEIMQENARLRDSDREWKGFCISCDKLVSWGNHAWGHDYSRKVKNICLCTRNINLQCNWCNRTTWPRWNKVAEEKVRVKYNENLAKRYWEGAVYALKECYEAYFKKDYDENWIIGDKKINKARVESYLVEEYIPELIKENELRWTGKDFKGKKNRRKIRMGYIGNIGQN